MRRINNLMVNHALKRTSPKGQAFLGVCVVCGQEDLPVSAVREKCSNPADLTYEEVMLKVLKK